MLSTIPDHPHSMQPCPSHSKTVESISKSKYTCLGDLFMLILFGIGGRIIFATNNADDHMKSPHCKFRFLCMVEHAVVLQRSRGNLIRTAVSALRPDKIICTLLGHCCKSESMIDMISLCDFKMLKITPGNGPVCRLMLCL